MVTYNWTWFKAAVVNSYGKTSPSDYESYMGRDKTWGGGVEISAAVFQYSLNFPIYKNVEEFYTEGEGNKKYCALYFWGGNHYYVVEDK